MTDFQATRHRCNVLFVAAHKNQGIVTKQEVGRFPASRAEPAQAGVI